MIRKRATAGWLGVGVLWAVAAGADPNAPPTIRHSKITAASRGEPVSIRAVVGDDAGAITSVRLFYTASRDAAPFKADMQDTGAGSYLGVIPAAVLSGVSEVSYYIEAVDDQAASSETPWYTIHLEATAPAPAGGEPAPREAPPVAVTAPAEAAAPEARQSSWVKPALYGGGAALLVGGGALLLSDGGGGDSDASDGTPSGVGVYAGSVTTTLDIPGSPQVLSSRAMRITVVSGGIVTSDSLEPGRYLEARLSGADFTFSVPVSETNLTGVIRYHGTVLTGRIAGSVDGSVTTPSGQNGTFSGTFFALKQ